MGKQWKQCQTLFWGGPKITVDGDCSHEIWTVVLEKTLESPLDCKEIQPVHPKENQSWVFIRRTDVEAATPVLWLPDAKSWLIWKDPDAGWERLRAGGEGDDRGWDGWMDHRLNGHGFGWTTTNWWWTGRPGVLWFMGSHRVGHNWVTELNWTELNILCQFTC